VIQSSDGWRQVASRLRNRAWAATFVNRCNTNQELAILTVDARSVVGRVINFPKQQLCQPSPLGRRRDTVSYQMLDFQFSDKVADVRRKIFARNAELTRKRLDDLAEREFLLEQFPDFQSDRIEGETDSMFDIEKHGSIFACGLPHRWRDGESFEI
jgi:hypothetical protein